MAESPVIPDDLVDNFPTKVKRAVGARSCLDFVWAANGILKQMTTSGCHLDVNTVSAILPLCLEAVVCCQDDKYKYTCLMYEVMKVISSAPARDNTYSQNYIMFSTKMMHLARAYHTAPPLY
jgi:hypothetical protein